MEFRPALWPELVAEWDLAPEEVSYIDRQQGFRCKRCRSNLRSMTLALAIMRSQGYDGLFKWFVRSIGRIGRLRILEINDAGQLTRWLKRIRGHVLVSYPAVDMQKLPYGDELFDLVVHSDTLEHVPDPMQGLKECQRVLRPGGFCCFTVPIVVGRPTRTREGLPPSFHGQANAKQAGNQVVTEYGSDVWKQVLEAGFDECRLTALEYPAGLALSGHKGRSASARPSWWPRLKDLL